MKKIQYNIYERDTKDASGKAKTDVSQILLKHGYKKLYSPSKYRIVRIVQQFFSILFLTRNTIIFIQYKANISFFYRILHYKKNIKKVAIIHDLESLRGIIPVREEIKLLNSFHTIISHNPQMTKWLKQNGIKSVIYDLWIFDYLLSEDVSANDNYDKNTVFFAGNLVKSKFLLNVSEIKGVHFNIYGRSFNNINDLKRQKNVSFKGSFSPNELIKNIEGGWGLVWDGDSLDTCSGLTGEYMRYNNPHKVSMCIVSERPIIIWKQSAMAEYIQSNHLGIVVDSLSKLFETINQVTDSDYKNILNCVRREKEILVKGDKLGQIISTIEQNN